MFSDRNMIDSPVKIIKTPVIIGFLTWLYIPVVTRLTVGLQGARVPFPMRMNKEMVLNMIYKPPKIRNSPPNRLHPFLTERSFSIQVGTKINTKKGKTKEINCFSILFIEISSY